MNKHLSLLLGAAFALTGSLAQASAEGVVISQVYGGGGNGGATYKNDFIELFNAGTTTVSLVGWSVQYAAATGSFNASTNLSGSLAPGQYYLVQQAAGTGGTTNLPTPDASGSIAMAAGAGKVALVKSTALLNAVTSPSGPTIVDFVGYGTIANLFEGSAAAPAPSATVADLRAVHGCTDTDSNSSDFTADTVTPRNTATALAPCGGAPVNAPIVASCPAFSVLAGSGGSSTFSATDADGIVNSVTAGALPSGITAGPLAAASAAGGTATLPISVAASTAAGSYTIAFSFANNQSQTTGCSAVVTVSAGAGLTPIYTIQGSGSTSPLVGQTVTTSGVVTKVMNNAFFLQDPTGDGNPATSDGVLVFTSTAPTVTAGQLIQLTGTVTEFNTGAANNADTLSHTVTELTSVSNIIVLGSGSVTPVTVTLPVASRDDLERYEGMVVTITGPLTVSQNFFLGRYGQLTLAALGRLETPTNRMVPGPGALALQDENVRRSIVLDDGLSTQNPFVTPYIGADNTVRAGDTTPSVTGVMDFGLATATNTDPGSYKIQPVTDPVFTRANPRTAGPEVVNGNYKVASFNVLNFFTTFTNGQTAFGGTGQGCTLGSSTSASNCRGANDLSEFVRQRTKIVEALAAINADAVGLMEIQNNGDVAAQYLVDALNTRLGSTLYAVVPAPAQGTGTDAIRVAMIYKPARLALTGASISDPDPINNRPPMAQKFTGNGESFMLFVNHLKSKGCDGASGLDTDQGDLQGCFNDTRVKQAQRLRTFVTAADPALRSVLVGDFNAYAQENPITTLTGAGFVDQVGRFQTFGYSYVFNGAAGRLDQALATSALSSKVTGAGHWQINADEPSIIDYNNEFKRPACPTCGPDLYSPTPYRASDHDPVVIGLQLGAAPVRVPVRVPPRVK